jgi:hypothetical protein
MPVVRRRLILLLVLPLTLAAFPIAAQPRHNTDQHEVFLPLMIMPPTANPFGFDLRSFVGDSVLEYLTIDEAPPKWVRAGDVHWSEIEPVRGGGYRWEVLSAVEANLRRLHERGIEPMLVVHRTPAWAQRVPGRLCSPPAPEYVGDFARFMSALAAHYAAGPIAVDYWEIWNEPDITTSQASDDDGFGCWADAALPYYGGAYYGEVLKQVYPAVKAGNPNATVLAGALLYPWPNDTQSQSFLRGILVSGAGQSFDALSFHAYGEWGAGDVLIAKTARIRQVLGGFGIANKPLFATEIAATCSADTVASCPPDFDSWKTRQANYAARIYAEAIALDLKGAFWYTLAIRNPGFMFSQLIDDDNGTLSPRPAYYAFRNSAVLLNGARYVGPPVVEPPPDQIQKVQTLKFRKSRSTLYVVWVPKTDFPVQYNLAVPIGASAICTDHLDQSPPTRYGCSDVNNDGMIPRAVNELPQYIEVFQ